MASSGVMKDSYVGSIVSSSCIQQNDEMPFCVTIAEDQQQTTDGMSDDKINSILFGGKTPEWALERGNQTDEDKIIHLSCTDEAKSTNINRTEEYNVGYSGISILPWEEFAFNPRVFNDLFYCESNSRITYDPEEVNVFFHGKNVMPPTIGDISENGKSWNIDIDNISDMRKVRKMLTERCSVFGVTLVYKEKRFAKPVRAPCLVLLDPNQGGLGDRLYTTLTKAMDTIHNQRRFCVEINLNACVERWCKSVLLTECKAVGAKLYVTNGEEYTPLNETTEDMVCCALCFPIWLLQTAIYKLHRMVTYDDYTSDFDADDIFLHGSFQDAQFQRQQIFKENGCADVFRIRSANQTDVKTLQALGTHKFVCVKKVEKVEEVNFFKEHNTASFGALVDKRKEKVLHKEKKISDKKKMKNKKSNASEVDESKSEEGIEEDNNMQTTYTNEAFSSSVDDNDNYKETGATPRIPEIASVLCAHDQDESVEVDVSANMEMREDNMFIKMTASLDQDAFDLRMQKAECTDKEIMPDSKSTTAVRSFQIFDSESESDTSEEDEYRHTQAEVSKSKDNFVEEMMKIEKTLPKIQRKASDVGQTNTKENSEKGETGRKSKSKKKIMVGQAFREITRTTDKPATKQEVSEENKGKPIVGNKKSEIETKSAENNSAGKNVDTSRENGSKDIKKETNDIIDNHTKVITTPKPGVINKSDKGGIVTEKQVDKTVNQSKIQDSTNVLYDKVQESTVLAFNFDDSSTDGDEVEMIYQSPSTRNVVSKPGKLSDKDSKLLKSKPDRVSGREIERVSTANNQTADDIIFEQGTHDIISSSDKCINRNVNTTKDVMDEADVSASNELLNHGKDTDLDPMFGVTKVETAMDITDLDDIDEDGNDVKPKAAVPPLKLNIGEKLGQKAKRVNKQYSSNRKYLGVSVPSKIKRK